jgi:hypothetical protein
MKLLHPIWHFFLCALAIWPVPHQLAVHFYNTHAVARLSGTEMSD